MILSFEASPVMRKHMSVIPGISGRMASAIKTHLRGLMDTKGRPRFNPSIRLGQGLSTLGDYPISGAYLKEFLLTRQLVEIDWEKQGALLIGASFRVENETPRGRETLYEPFSALDPFTDSKVRACRGSGVFGLLDSLQKKFPGLRIEHVSDHFPKGEPAVINVLDHTYLLGGRGFDSIFAVVPK